MKKTIVAGVLSNNKKEFLKQLKNVSGKTKNIQIDIMDGKFVKQRTISIRQIPNLKKYKANFEAHLMIYNPHKHIKELKQKGFKKILFHYEAYKKPAEIEKTIALIKKHRMIAGITLNPDTSLAKIKPFLKQLNLVMFMSVYPGKMGQRFITKVLKKIKTLRKANKKINIEIDGGISPKTAPKAIKAGANIILSGSFITKNKNPRRAVSQLRKLL